ncbi:hypothetical protein SAMN02745146_1550 [Hymenobacter daecheongensis DSM 21074]|uniref:4-amino-4-deoxy-L-arabinose transferase n=1 Tax=Hymenobacter daecheongensis DSM 21074 TaxID=1121955 RepID=A0A1M6E4T8_9BACT|nr:DUF6044 family protein [Hymenobacter daecheongensis]SHI80288.1 hypothetical protein SAMN02745146_1550 [Hymenobacter daecheongensis DSM 21074]
MPVVSRLRTPLAGALLGLLLFLLPFLLLQERSYVQIDDNLDVELTIPYLLTRHHVALDYRPTAVVAPIMNGLPRNALRPGLSATVLVFGLLEPLPAYLMHQALVRLLGLLGLYVLLRRHFLPEASQRRLAAALALAWAVLPAYTIYGLSILGQPWLLLAFLNLRRGPARWTDWAIMAAFPLWSMFVFVGPFALAAGAALLLLDWGQGRGVAWRAVGGLALLTLMYLVVEYPLFFSLLVAKQFTSHRLEFDLSQLTMPGFGAGLKSTAQYFFMGQYHASRFFRAAVLLAVVAVWGLRAGSPAARRQLGALLGVLVVLAIFCGFYPQFIELVQDNLPLLRTFNLSRFHFLTPLLWFIVLALSLRLLPAGRLRMALVAAHLLTGLSMNTEWLNNLRELAGRPKPTEPNYTAYVAPALFGHVQQRIRQQTGQEPAAYRVACLGFPPGIAQLNDFYTLDSYQNNYPIEYKHRFRPIIAGEMAKSPLLRPYFDAWGNRCYLFSSELGKDFRVGAFQNRVVQDFAFDAAAFQRLGGRYVLSAARLAAPTRSGLVVRGEFSARNVYWHLYLYEVRPPVSGAPAGVGEAAKTAENP